MNLVVDASMVVAALVDNTDVGRWAEGLLAEHALAAPHLLLVEVTNILRRVSLAGTLAPAIASQAHADLLGLRIELFAYEPFAPRVWALRDNFTSYDAWYVAIAEAIDAPLATIDMRLVRASGSRCRFSIP